MVESPEQIATLMVRAGAPPFRLSVQQEDLESHFLRLNRGAAMRSFGAALWAETLKARRSLIMPLTVLAMSLLPMLGGLFMIILKDPESARELGLISTKAQLAAGVADWASFFGILLQGSAIAGAIIFAFITSWVFGAEFSNRMNTRLLALPTRRLSIVAAKFSLIGSWTVGLGLLVYVEALLVGRLVVIPGWSEQLV